MGNERLALGDGCWEMEDEQWEMGDWHVEMGGGCWEMGDEQWEMGTGWCEASPPPFPVLGSCHLSRKGCSKVLLSACFNEHH